MKVQRSYLYVTLIVGILLSAAYVSCVQSSKYVFPAPSSAGLDDESATLIAKEVLSSHGVNVHTAFLVPYDAARSNTLIGRSTTNPSRALTLWRETGSTKEWDWWVTMERKGNKVECQVGKSK